MPVFIVFGILLLLLMHAAATMVPPRAPHQQHAVERFWTKVRKTNGCWLYTGAPFDDGYGAFQPEHGVAVRAHRFALEVRLGEPIPEGYLVLHTCDIRRCVRNDDEGVYVVRGVEYVRFGHLWLGTPAANSADMADKGRAASGDLNGSRLHPDRLVRGEHRPNARLYENDVREIRRAYNEGRENIPSLARLYGVGTSTIWRIIQRETWKAVPEDEP